MIYANAPSQFVLAWGANAGVGYIRTVPTASQISITAGAASFNDGFVPLNMTPVNAGGVPPFGQDMNGVLNVITSWLQYIQAGYVPQYSSTFSGTIGGYPKGALIGSLAGNGALYASATDNNTNNPDTTPANWIMVPNSLIGSARNLTGTCGGGNKIASWSFDQLCAGTGLGGGGFLLHQGSFTFNGNNTGLNGMDTGVMPTNGALYIYAMFNPTTGASGVIGTTAGAGATVYSGTATPSGYTASCLIWSGVTTGTNFYLWSQYDRYIVTSQVTVLSSGTATVYTSVSLTTVVPPNAKSIVGTMVASGIAGSVAISSNSAGTLGTIGMDGTGEGVPFSNVLLATSQTIWYGNSSASISTSITIVGYTI